MSLNSKYVYICIKHLTYQMHKNGKIAYKNIFIDSLKQKFLKFPAVDDYRQIKSSICQSILSKFSVR